MGFHEVPGCSPGRFFKEANHPPEKSHPHPPKVFLVGFVSGENCCDLTAFWEGCETCSKISLEDTAFLKNLEDAGLVRSKEYPYKAHWRYMIWYDMIWYDMIWYDMIWYDMIWYDMIWYDMIWYDMICNTYINLQICANISWNDVNLNTLIEWIFHREKIQWSWRILTQTSKDLTFQLISKLKGPFFESWKTVFHGFLFPLKQIWQMVVS